MSIKIVNKAIRIAFAEYIGGVIQGETVFSSMDEGRLKRKWAIFSINWRNNPQIRIKAREQAYPYLKIIR